MNITGSNHFQTKNKPFNLHFRLVTLTYVQKWRRSNYTRKGQWEKNVKRGREAKTARNACIHCLSRRLEELEIRLI